MSKALTRQICIVKLGQDGAVQWQRTIEGRPGSSQRATIAFENDTGYLLAGRGNSLPLAFHGERDAVSEEEVRASTGYANTLRLAADGQLGKRSLLGRSKRDAETISPHCGVKVDDGYILVGIKTQLFQSPSKGGLRGANSPWIGKISPDGTLVWDLLLAGDDRNVYDARDVIGPNFCGGPLISDAKVITFSLPVRVLGRSSGGIGRREVAGASAFAVLVAQVDLAGAARSTLLIEGAAQASLLPSSNGFVVIDQPLPMSEHGVRKTILDSSLKISGQTESNVHGFALHSALSTNDGGFHIFGEYATQSNSRGKTAVGYLRDGELTDVFTFGGWFIPLSSARAIARGGSPAEVMTVLRRDDNIKAVRLLYER